MTIAVDMGRKATKTNKTKKQTEPPPVILDQVGLLVTVTGSPHLVANVADITITEPPPVILDHVGLLVAVTGSPHQVANVADITITEPPPVILDQVGLLVTVTWSPHQVLSQFCRINNYRATSSYTRSGRFVGYSNLESPPGSQCCRYNNYRATSSHTRSARLGFIETTQPALGFGHH